MVADLKLRGKPVLPTDIGATGTDFHYNYNKQRF